MTHTGTGTLTRRQRAALDVITNTPHGVSPSYLAARLRTSKHGAASTAASLVRRRLIIRHLDRDRHTIYFPAGP